MTTRDPETNRIHAPEGDGTDLELQIVRSALADEFDVIEELDRGGMAVVYRARELGLDREVAVKVLSSAYTSDATFVERFLQEARTAAQLEHPHIIPIHRVGRVGRVIFFAMKYLKGPSLSTVLRHDTQLPATEVRRLLTEVGEALRHAAEHGVVHRDVKPGNIILDEANRYVVTDFGIAKSSGGPDLTGTGMTVGTPHYMSPEQIRGTGVDGRSDIYSLGIVGYRCLVGQVPYDADETFAILNAHLSSPIPRPALTTAEKRELFHVIERMVQKAPEARIQSGAAVVTALTGRSSTGPREATTLVSSSPGTWSHHGTLQSIARFLTAVRTRVGWASGLVRRVVHDAISRGGPPARAALARLQQHPAVRWVNPTPRRLTAVGLGTVTLLLAFSLVGVAADSRSQCPTGDAAPSFSAMLDAVGTHRVGRDLDVAYDVCGLEAGSMYTARLEVKRTESFLKRLVGEGTQPVVVSFDERAKGPATRRHRSLELGALPAGSYTLQLGVIDADGRRRKRSLEFQLVQR